MPPCPSEKKLLLLGTIIDYESKIGIVPFSNILAGIAFSFCDDVRKLATAILRPISMLGLFINYYNLLKSVVCLFCCFLFFLGGGRKCVQAKSE